MAQSGYDRWDALEKYRTYRVADNRLMKRYLGFGWQPGAEGGYRPITMYALIGGMTRRPSPPISDAE